MGRRVLLLYAALTAVLLLALAVVLLRGGAAAFYAFQGPADVASVAWKFGMFVQFWLLVGGFIALSLVPAFAARHAAFLVVFAVLAFGYLALVREPTAVLTGDFRAYFLAARDVAAGVPIDQRPDRLYLYPPLLATLLVPLVPLGLEAAARVARVANYGLVLALAPLLYLALQRCFRHSRETAALATLVALSASVPILNTLVYLQINLAVVDLMLACLLLYPRFPFASALALALASHLKVYPAALVLPFLLIRDWRWCAWFAAGNALIIAATSVATGPEYYWSFLHQVATITEPGIRNVAVGSFVHNTIRLLGLPLEPVEHVVTTGLRLGLAAAALAGAWRLRWRGMLAHGDAATRAVRTAFVTLPVAMLLVSPSIWPHHIVLLVPTLLALVPAIREPREGWSFLFLYAFLILMPVNEVYPVSYLRLLGLGLLVLLLHRVASHPDDDIAPWFVRVETAFASAAAAAKGAPVAGAHRP